MNKDIINEVSKIIDVENENLFMSLGQELFYPEHKLGFSPEQDDKAKSKGKLWWQRKFEQFRIEVCNTDILNKYNESDYLKKRVEICAAIADLFMASFSLIAACTIAVLIFNHGLETLCDDE